MGLWGRVMAAYSAFRDYNAEPSVDLDTRYGRLWSLYDGTMFDAAWKARPARYRDPRLYLNTRLLWKHVESTVDFYAATVYQGSLSTDGQPLPGGRQEAIPIDAQTGGKATDDALRLGIAELWNTSNWSAQMALRPMYGACLGDCLTVLIDRPSTGKVLPLTIWPGYVADLELDSVGNVKYAAIEYPVHVRPRRKDDGIKEERYTYREELSPEDFRYYKDGKPFDYSGRGEPVVENPYKAPGEARGFVPAVWDRHKQVWQDRGHCAFEGTVQALLEVNSFLSHGFDYQRKAFSAPVVIQGQIAGAGRGGVLRLARQAVEGSADDPGAAAQALAESQDVLTATGDKVGIFQLGADLGQALAVVEAIQRGIERENPEGTFYERLGEMTQLTGPGADRALGNATSKCNLARAGYDAQSVKFFQMWLAISGMRVNAGDWGDALSRRQEAWRPFGMESYRRGELDFAIMPRPVVPMTPEEMVNLVVLKESIQSEWGMREAGIPDEAIAATLGERERARDAQLAAFSVAGAGQDEGAAGPSGPTGVSGRTGG